MYIEKNLRRFKVTYLIGRQIRKVQFFIQFMIIFNIKKLLRENGITKDSPYEKLKMLKNKHQGERCFIVATGPSLTMQDLEKMKNEITFSMNSICLAFDETDWRPTYYGIQDMNVYSKMREYIEKLNVECKFIGDNISKHIKGLENQYTFPLNMLHHNVNNKKYRTKFSDNAYAVVYSGYSITYSLLQIAAYMGFEEIYLVGTDCNYPSNMKHHFKEYGHVDPNFSQAHDQMIAAYEEAKKYTENNNIKIYNATRGGMLEVFERVDLDKVLVERKKTFLRHRACK